MASWGGGLHLHSRGVTFSILHGARVIFSKLCSPNQVICLCTASCSQVSQNTRLRTKPDFAISHKFWPMGVVGFTCSIRECKRFQHNGTLSNRPQWFPVNSNLFFLRHVLPIVGFRIVQPFLHCGDWKYFREFCSNCAPFEFISLFEITRSPLYTWVHTGGFCLIRTMWSNSFESRELRIKQAD